MVLIMKRISKTCVVFMLATILLVSNSNFVSAKSYYVKKIKWSNVKSKRTMYKGTSKYFKVKITPSKAKKKKLQWYSSNKKVVRVSSKGLVKAVGNGTAYVTARVKTQKSKKVRCKITVKTKKVSSVKFSSSQKCLEVGQTYTRKPSVSPSYAYNRGVTYKSSNTKIATVSSSGKITAKGIGYATITATAKDGSKKKGSYKVRVIGKIKSDSTRFIAHRGLSAQAPENTRYAFELAAKEGYWGMETDVRMTRDNKFILLHDATLKRMCGVDKRPEDMDYEDIRTLKITGGNNISKYKNIKDATQIASLEEYLKICKKSEKVPLIELKVEQKNGEKINMKDEDMKRVYDEVKSIMGDRPYTFTSFNLETVIGMRYLKMKDSDASNVSLRHIVNSPDLDNLSYYKRRGIQLDCNYKNVSLGTLSDFHSAGLTICAWVIDDKETAWDYIQRDADYITTNTKLW
ncbi:MULTISPECIES: glycerophosphodiester phosphodiesterase family protein [Anaerostipes]|uniref:Glycerophosphodiester phosphodiesterase family protein n=2 Tax=Anaerostipes TaxID=207244 RepID=A0ABV4DF42_9FIRM|nr:MULTISPECIES: glycerophosphodiester phosphodiesterase family protein [Anaerostipes]